MQRLAILLFLILVSAACSGDESDSAKTTGSGVDTTTTTSGGSSSSSAVGPDTTTTAGRATTSTAGRTTTTAGRTTTTAGGGTTSTSVVSEVVSVTITAPRDLTQLFSTFDTVADDYVAEVELAATVTGERVTVRWHSDIDGELGEGSSLLATITTGGQDVANHTITATALDADGNEASAVIRLQVALPSG